MPFKAFDPEEDVGLTWQNLPHWRQTGVTYFVTTRLVDSLPVSVIEQRKEERAQWPLRNGARSESELRCLSSPKRREFKRLFTAQWHQWLDFGYGNCHLRNQEIANVLSD